jgi:hypothetical protein
VARESTVVYRLYCLAQLEGSECTIFSKYTLTKYLLGHPAYRLALNSMFRHEVGVQNPPTLVDYATHLLETRTLDTFEHINLNKVLGNLVGFGNLGELFLDEAQQAGLRHVLATCQPGEIKSWMLALCYDAPALKGVTFTDDEIANMFVDAYRALQEPHLPNPHVARYLHDFQTDLPQSIVAGGLELTREQSLCLRIALWGRL